MPWLRVGNLFPCPAMSFFENRITRKPWEGSVNCFSRQERITLAEVRDLLGTSRKYAQALLEHLDATGMTIRDGDYRRLRKR